MFGLLAVIAMSIPLCLTPVPVRRETCPGAVSFIKHGQHNYWTRHMRLVCTIGAHDFYGRKVK